MATRTTLSYADEIYAGNAYRPAYSPDGRRGVEMSHPYMYRAGAVDVLDVGD